MHAIMISYREALEKISAVCEPLETETLPLEAALGRVAACDLYSRMNVPPFANSAMDGFAFRARDTTGASTEQAAELPVAGIAAAGQPPQTGPRGQAVEIMTGAVVPEGYDTVLPVERVAAQRNAAGNATLLEIEEPVEPGRHIRAAAEDFHKGELILRNGTRIGPQHIMGLAATGTDEIEVRRKPGIGILSTGSELIASGIPEHTGMIRDSNGPYLRSYFDRGQFELVHSDSAIDDSDQLAERIAACCGHADIILTTGGVSAGRYDLIPDALKQLGADIIFHKVKIRPGKPLLFARLPDNTLFFGLPGNPVAVAAGTRFFVQHALSDLLGSSIESPRIARCAAPMQVVEHMTFFGKGHCKIGPEGQLQARLLPGQESFRIKPLMQANCWVIVPQGTASVAAGDNVAVAPLFPGDYSRWP